DFPGWYGVVFRNRDSELLDESNFESALKELGGESENVQIFRFGHWACGWWEVLGVRDDKIPGAEDIEKRLAQYPVLDEDEYSRRESDATYENFIQAGGDKITGVESEVYQYLSDEEPNELESRDGKGGWPSEESIDRALVYLQSDTFKRQEAETAGQLRLIQNSEVRARGYTNHFEGATK
ncbi:MAG: hypothetical protein Q7S00_03010, partial [bacterium]|nr:hypothetical protein [bacterium]